MAWSTESLLGRRYHMTTVVEEYPRRRLLIRCDCGKELNRARRLFGKLKSCRCASLQFISKANGRHWMTRDRLSGHSVWVQMRKRCLKPNNTSYANYGGRGIKICERWDRFENFREDMGPRPSLRHSIERIDVNGNYEPSNCRWATPAEQSRNTRRVRRVMYRGQERSLSELCAEFSLSDDTVRERLSRGWDLERALTTQPKVRAPKRASNE